MNAPGGFFGGGEGLFISLIYELKIIISWVVGGQEVYGFFCCVWYN